MFNLSDVERIADDIWKDRRITSATYCGECGYNLKTLPYVYTCPECGNQYNARPLAMKGIFLPQEGTAPMQETTAVLVWAGIAFAIFRFSPRPLEPASWVMSGVAAALSLINVGLSIRRWRRFIHTRVVAHRIVRSEEES